MQWNRSLSLEAQITSLRFYNWSLFVPSSDSKEAICESFSAPLQQNPHFLIFSAETETAHCFQTRSKYKNTKDFAQCSCRNCNVLKQFQNVMLCLRQDWMLPLWHLHCASPRKFRETQKRSHRNQMRAVVVEPEAALAVPMLPNTKRGMRNAAGAARECETGCQMPLSQTDWAEQKLHRKGMNRAWKAAEVFLPGIVTIMTIMTITLVTCWWHVVKKTHMSRHCAATLRCLQVTRNFFRTSLKHLLCRDFAKIKQSFRKADKQHLWAEHKQESLELIWAWWFS